MVRGDCCGEPWRTGQAKYGGVCARELLRRTLAYRAGKIRRSMCEGIVAANLGVQGRQNTAEYLRGDCCGEPWRAGQANHGGVCARGLLRRILAYRAGKIRRQVCKARGCNGAETGDVKAIFFLQSNETCGRLYSCKIGLCLLFGCFHGFGFFRFSAYGDFETDCADFSGA